MIKFDNSHTHIEHPVLGRVSVYPVGLLASIMRDWNAIVVGRRPAWYTKRSIKYIIFQVRRRNWRAVKNSFNGFLAEPLIWHSRMGRCGSAWTKKRAYKHLLRIARQAGVLSNG